MGPHRCCDGESSGGDRSLRPTDRPAGLSDTRSMGVICHPRVTKTTRVPSPSRHLQQGSGLLGAPVRGD
jgi:hypothetical protein